jgi:hypothetical protein
MQFPYLMHARPNHADWHLDVWILNAILALWMSASRRESTSSERLQQSSHDCVLERKKLVEHWESIGHAAEKSRRMQAGAVRNFLTQGKVWTKSSHHPDRWCFEQMGFQKVWHVVRTAGALNRWASGRYDMSFGWLVRNRIFWVANCAESSGNTSE